MSERRYSDEEVQRILAGAAEADSATDRTSADRGLTLADIQRIAAEAGLSPTSVVVAAGALDRAPATMGPRVLGVPAGVAQTVALSRPMDDTEWRRLVVFLRDTFEAHGREEQGEGRREWRNGNLRVAVESIGGSALLQMRTRKESARSLVGVGGSLALGSALLGAASAAPHGATHALAGLMPMALAGLAMSVAGVLQLPGWSSTRRRQFQAVADYVRQLSAGGA